MHNSGQACSPWTAEMPGAYVEPQLLARDIGQAITGASATGRLVRLWNRQWQPGQYPGLDTGAFFLPYDDAEDLPGQRLEEQRPACLPPPAIRLCRWAFPRLPLHLSQRPLELPRPLGDRRS